MPYCASLLQLLCQYERNSVLKFLETFDSYRVEHCLRLCQEYGITDAAAFLLERVGDVGSALLLTLSGLDAKFSLLETVVERVVASVGPNGSVNEELFCTVLNMEEVCRFSLFQIEMAIHLVWVKRVYMAISRFMWFLFQVKDICNVLHACIGLCQRNTPRLNPEESESLWFKLLDS